MELSQPYNYLQAKIQAIKRFYLIVESLFKKQLNKEMKNENDLCMIQKVFSKKYFHDKKNIRVQDDPRLTVFK